MKQRSNKQLSAWTEVSWMRARGTLFREGCSWVGSLVVRG